jgi:Helix-hairpin-helix domain
MEEMATTRGRRGAGSAPQTATPAAPAVHVRAPEDEIGGVAAPVPEAQPAEAAEPARTHSRRAGPAAEGAAAAAKKRGTKRETYTETAARRRKEKEVDQLQADLRAFAIARPMGWDHADWEAFLAHLAEHGHDTSSPESIGTRLEQERLAVVLGGVQGLGPKRVQALVDHFHTLWSAGHADVAEVAAVPGMNRPLAEKLLATLRERFPS